MLTTEDDSFPYDPRYESVRECVESIREKTRKGKAIKRWEEFLLSRFDEWRQISNTPCTIIRSESGKVSFVVGVTALDPVPTFTFEQILQAAIPLRSLFKTGDEAATAAEELLQACYHVAITAQKRELLKSRQREAHSRRLSFEEGICRITGNQRLDRAKAAFEELVQIEQADALFSGLFSSSGGDYDPDHPEFEELIWAEFPKIVPSPASEAARHQKEGFTLADIERLTHARNVYIEQKHLSGRPVSQGSKLIEESGCVPLMDKEQKRPDSRQSKPDKKGKKSDMAANLKRPPSGKR